MAHHKLDKEVKNRSDMHKRQRETKITGHSKLKNLVEMNPCIRNLPKRIASNPAELMSKLGRGTQSQPKRQRQTLNGKKSGNSWRRQKLQQQPSPISKSFELQQHQKSIKGYHLLFNRDASSVDVSRVFAPSQIKKDAEQLQFLTDLSKRIFSNPTTHQNGRKRSLSASRLALAAAASNNNNSTNQTHPLQRGRSFHRSAHHMVHRKNTTMTGV